MSALKAYFNYSLNQSSPIQKGYERVVNYDELGNEFITWKEIDYPSIQAELGTIDQWSLSSLMSAGINPDFPIHTAAPTRLDGFDTAMDAVDKINSVLDSLEENTNSEN